MGVKPNNFYGLFILDIKRPQITKINFFGLLLYIVPPRGLKEKLKKVTQHTKTIAQKKAVNKFQVFEAKFVYKKETRMTA